MTKLSAMHLSLIRDLAVAGGRPVPLPLPLATALAEKGLVRRVFDGWILEEAGWAVAEEEFGLVEPPLERIPVWGSMPSDFPPNITVYGPVDFTTLVVFNTFVFTTASATDMDVNKSRTIAGKVRHIMRASACAPAHDGELPEPSCYCSAEERHRDAEGTTCLSCGYEAPQ